MAYREPTYPPAEPRVALWRRALGAVASLFADNLGWMVPGAVAAGAFVCVCSLLIWASETGAENARARCSRLGAALDLPTVIESAEHSCICANPETGRVERFTPDLSRRAVVVDGVQP